MLIRRRLLDAVRSPRRLWWLGARVAQLVAHGEFGATLARTRARSPDASGYRDWLRKRKRVNRAPPSSSLMAPEVRLRHASSEGGADPLPLLWAQTIPPWRVLVCGDSGAREVIADPRPPPAFDHPSRQRADWALLIDSRILPEPHMIEAFAQAMALHPDAIAAYCDHDHLDRNGARERPVLKSAWDPDQMLERNYCGSVVAVRVGLPETSNCETTPPTVASVLLGLVAKGSDRVVHIPDVLYRVPPDEDAMERDVSESYDRLAVSAAAALGAEANSLVARVPHLKFASLAASETVSFVIPTRDRLAMLQKCIDSIPSSVAGAAVEIVLVDNGSTEPGIREYYQGIGERRDARVLDMAQPFNFARLCNAGAAESRGRVLVFLNNDAYFEDPESAVELVSLAIRPWTGAAGPLLLYGNGSIQSAGVLVGVNRTATSALSGFSESDPAARAWCGSRRRVSAVMGACVAVEREKFAAIGGFDEQFAVSLNEVDLCLRLEAKGHANVFTPYSRVVHVEGGTRGYVVTPDERRLLDAEESRFLQRWSALMNETDPAHHPWLSSRGNPFDFRQTERDDSARFGWRGARA